MDKNFFVDSDKTSHHEYIMEKNTQIRSGKRLYRGIHPHIIYNVLIQSNMLSYGAPFLGETKIIDSTACRSKLGLFLWPVAIVSWTSKPSIVLIARPASSGRKSPTTVTVLCVHPARLHVLLSCFWWIGDCGWAGH